MRKTQPQQSTWSRSPGERRAAATAEPAPVVNDRWYATPLAIDVGADPDRVVELVELMLKARGWRLVIGTWWPWSWTDPLGRAIRVSDWSKRTPRERARLVVHELVHVWQLDRASLWDRLKLAIGYCVSASRRLAMEIEARAHHLRADVLMRWRPDRVRPTFDPDPGGLAGWTAPYWTGADRQEVRDAIEARVLELLGES